MKRQNTEWLTRTGESVHMCQLHNSVPGCGGNNDRLHQRICASSVCNSNGMWGGKKHLMESIWCCTICQDREKKKTYLKRGEVRNWERWWVHFKGQSHHPCPFCPALLLVLLWEKKDFFFRPHSLQTHSIHNAKALKTTRALNQG